MQAVDIQRVNESTRLQVQLQSNALLLSLHIDATMTVWKTRIRTQAMLKRILDFSICFAILRCAHHISVYDTCANYAMFMLFIFSLFLSICSCAIFHMVKSGR